MDRAGGQEHVDAGIRRALAAPPTRGRCPFRCSGPARRSSRREPCCAISRTASKSPGEAIGKAGLDHVDAQIHQRLRDLQLFLEVHAAAGRLLAVAQRGVENDDRAWFVLWTWQHLELETIIEQ